MPIETLPAPLDRGLLLFWEPWTDWCTLFVTGSQAYCAKAETCINTPWPAAQEK